MEGQSRRGLLKKAAAIAAGTVAAATVVDAKTPQHLRKKSYPAAKSNETNEKAPLFSSAVSYGNLVFIAGIGYHEKATIEEATTYVLDELEKNLIAAGSSMEKVLKVNVYLNDIADWPRMNTSYAGRWGKIPPVRTTVAPAGGIPGNSLVEIDCIAYI